MVKNDRRTEWVMATGKPECFKKVTADVYTSRRSRPVEGARRGTSPCQLMTGFWTKLPSGIRGEVSAKVRSCIFNLYFCMLQLRPIALMFLLQYALYTFPLCLKSD